MVCKWSPPVATHYDWSVVYQIRCPFCVSSACFVCSPRKPVVLTLGVTKTYQLFLKHFFWPGIKTDVAKYCPSCHVCQITGKPNQVIPLHPIPAIGELFERVIVDCVGPLPTKSGNQFLLTMICAAIRFPKGVLPRKITAGSIVKALKKFFSTFSLPHIMQTDQGTNYKSKLFKQVLEILNVQHVVSSAYHPESQCALERLHRTLKSMSRKYCLENEKSWDEGVSFTLFAAHEAFQESLGFSPVSLVFGHTPRSSLKSLQEKFLSFKSSPEKNVLDYISQFHEHLHQANALAKESLSTS